MLKDQNSVDSFFDSTTYHLNKKCLILAGGWPFLNPRKRKTIWLAINFSLFIGFVAEIIYIGEIIDRTTEVINCLMVICCAILAFCLSINGAVKSHSVKRLLNSVRENWNDLQSDDERNIFSKYANYGRIFTIGLSVCYYLVLLCQCVSPLIPSTLHYCVTGNWTAPERNILDVEFFVDPVKYYWPIFIQGAIGTVVAVWMLVAYDLFFVVVVLHCCGMFAVLRYKIKQMDIVLYRYSYDRQLAVKKIEEIVMYHLKCLEFAQKIEDFFCIQCIIQILVNTIVISVIQLADTSPQESFKFAFVGCSGTFRLAFFNVCGQIVNDQSLRVHDQLIYTTWYEYPIRARKLFVILYNRSAEPCNLTGAKMVNLNLATYSALMKTAMSYFMMIIETQ
ncbi:hypothetical protein TKK_0010772 [Trichogramma kaykai]